MPNLRQLFLRNLGQTSPDPMLLEVESAEGCYLFDTDRKKYLDLISGISVSHLGHRRREVIDAVKKQVENYSHLMVYGEYANKPQTSLATFLLDQLPSSFEKVYFVSTGSEAIEAALKLAKRSTNRKEVISFYGAYHGSTAGALSAMGDEVFKNSFRPLVPGHRLIHYNEEDLGQITERTAAVLVEYIRAEAGNIPVADSFLRALHQRCKETGALLIADEIQTGMGKTGKLFAFQHSEVVPDILCLAKAFGAGLPLGALVSPAALLDSFKSDPVLGHISTFGGNPVSCAAGLAGLKVLLDHPYIEDVDEKERLFRSGLRHNKILNITGKGLMLAVELGSTELNMNLISRCREKGLITDWFLFKDSAFRIAPPLIITSEQIEEACTIIRSSLDEI